jgi:hypothetical protein
MAMALPPKKPGSTWLAEIIDSLRSFWKNPRGKDDDSLGKLVNIEDLSADEQDMVREALKKPH